MPVSAGRDLRAMPPTVAADHRQRLVAAMTAAAAAEGYARATVSRVVELAGVSRATFYEHFSGREECFLAAYRERSGGVRAAVRAATEAGAPADKPATVLDILLAELAADPDGVRLVLIEALAAPTWIRAEHEELISDLEQLVAGYLDDQGEERAIQIPATALLVGIGEVVATRALRGDVEDLDKVRDALLSWIAAYRLPPGEAPLPQRGWGELGRFSRVVPPRPVSEPTLLPRGRTALSTQMAASARRQRLLDATARLTAAKGYSALTVAGIAAAARVPRAAFYSHFQSKEEALMAAQTQALQGAMGAAASEFVPALPWAERVWKAGEAFLAYVAAHPDYACLDFVESYCAGPTAIHHRQENHSAFTLFLEDGYRLSPGAALLPRLSSEAIGAGIYGLMRSLVVAGETERMLSILPAAAYTALAPFIGPKEAVDLVRAKARGAR